MVGGNAILVHAEIALHSYTLNKNDNYWMFTPDEK